MEPWPGVPSDTPLVLQLSTLYPSLTTTVVHCLLRSSLEELGTTDYYGMLLMEEYSKMTTLEEHWKNGMDRYW